MAEREAHASTQLEQVGKELRAMMPFLHARNPKA
jgi:ketol-acid reductoisomerase